LLRALRDKCRSATGGRWSLPAARATLFLALLAVITTTAYFHLTRMDNDSSVLAVISGHAKPPVQHRPLTPAIVGLAIRSTSWSVSRAEMYVNFAAMIVAFTVFFRYLRRFYEAPEAWIGVLLLSLSLICGALQKVAYSVGDRGGRMPADLTQVMFFVVLLWVIFFEQKWLLWYFLFVAATFNRETTVTLIPVLFLAWKETAGKARAALHGAASVALFAAIEAGLFYLYPGKSHERAYVWNLEIWLHPSFQAILSLAIVFAGSWLFLSRLKALPRQQQIALWCIPPYFAAIALWGLINELRVWNELSVVVIPLAVAGMRGRVRAAN